MKSYASSSTKTKATLCAVLAAAFYAVSVPMSKLFIADVRPAMLAAFLYLGAGVGMTLSVFVPWMFIRSSRQSSRIEVTTGTGHSSWEKQDLPFVLAMIALDIAAPILLMFGVSLTTSATVSLLNNFEIVATSVIAFVAFKEEVSRRLWLAIASVTVSSIILSVESDANFSLNYGAIFVLAACVCSGSRKQLYNATVLQITAAISDNQRHVFRIRMLRRRQNSGGGGSKHWDRCRSDVRWLRRLRIEHYILYFRTTKLRCCKNFGLLRYRSVFRGGFQHDYPR